MLISGTAVRSSSSRTSRTSFWTPTIVGLWGIAHAVSPMRVVGHPDGSPPSGAWGGNWVGRLVLGLALSGFALGSFRTPALRARCGGG